ncbi:MAG: hypothetical protein QCI00_09150 [Candidatus Thermoplasmatota archaeon]|nr:hypothetical protein [Candidatus Thermoplasmatota archaeon]
MAEEKIGIVTHFFNNINVAAIKITHGELHVGDTIHITGAHTNFSQAVQRMEIDREPIEIAKPGDEIGIRVEKRVREHDLVYKE